MNDLLISQVDKNYGVDYFLDSLCLTQILSKENEDSTKEILHCILAVFRKELIDCGRERQSECLERALCLRFGCVGVIETKKNFCWLSISTNQLGSTTTLASSTSLGKRVCVSDAVVITLLYDELKCYQSALAQQDEIEAFCISLLQQPVRVQLNRNRQRRLGETLDRCCA